MHTILKTLLLFLCFIGSSVAIAWERVEVDRTISTDSSDFIYKGLDGKDKCCRWPVPDIIPKAPSMKEWDAQQDYKVIASNDAVAEFYPKVPAFKADKGFFVENPDLIFKGADGDDWCCIWPPPDRMPKAPKKPKRKTWEVQQDFNVSALYDPVVKFDLRVPVFKAEKDFAVKNTDLFFKGAGSNDCCIWPPPDRIPKAPIQPEWEKREAQQDFKVAALYDVVVKSDPRMLRFNYLKGFVVNNIY